MIRYSLLLVLSVFLSGCANWALKERCEKTNWFEYSQGVAFDGRYLEEDGLIKDCRKVDRISAVQIDQGFKLGREKMCQYDEIFSRAKEGIPVFFKFCDGLDMARMKGKYSDGLVLFCTQEKAYSFGKSGKVYKNLCNANQEKKFLPAYFKGRKEYLVDSIASNERSLVDLQYKETSLAASESRLSLEYLALPNASVCNYKSVYNEATQKNEQRLICEEADYVRQQRSRISGDLSGVRSRLDVIREEQKNTTALLRQLKDDLSKVP